MGKWVSGVEKAKVPSVSMLYPGRMLTYLKMVELKAVSQ